MGIIYVCMDSRTQSRLSVWLLWRLVNFHMLSCKICYEVMKYLLNLLIFYPLRDALSRERDINSSVTYHNVSTLNTLLYSRCYMAYHFCLFLFLEHSTFWPFWGWQFKKSLFYKINYWTDFFVLTLWFISRIPFREQIVATLSVCPSVYTSIRKYVFLLFLSGT